MSSSLPPEILDLIVHHLHDEPTPLSTCCLVYNSWVSRTRRHLFARVELHSPGPSLESWMKTFPDPSNSPAHYTRSLHLQFFGTRAVAVSDAFPWIRSFSHIVDLQVTVGKRRIPFVQLYGLSPALKSLHLFGPIAPLSEVLDFICSFPLLEDLSLRSPRLLDQENADGCDGPPISPKFTGSLLLIENDDRITRKLLDLQGGLHFSKVSVTRLFGERDLTKELVSTCSNTLESLCVDIYPSVFSITSVVDKWLINTPRYTHVRDAAIARPFQGDKTQGCGVSIVRAKSEEHQRGDPNCYIHKPSANHHIISRYLFCRPPS